MRIFRIEGWRAERIDFHFIRGLSRDKQVNTNGFCALFADLNAAFAVAQVKHEHKHLLTDQSHFGVGVDMA